MLPGCLTWRVEPRLQKGSQLPVPARLAQPGRAVRHAHADGGPQQALLQPPQHFLQTGAGLCFGGVQSGRCNRAVAALAPQAVHVLCNHAVMRVAAATPDPGCLPPACSPQGPVDARACRRITVQGRLCAYAFRLMQAPTPACPAALLALTSTVSACRKSWSTLCSPCAPRPRLSARACASTAAATALWQAAPGCPWQSTPTCRAATCSALWDPTTPWPSRQGHPWLRQRTQRRCAQPSGRSRLPGAPPAAGAGCGQGLVSPHSGVHPACAAGCRSAGSR